MKTLNIFENILNTAGSERTKRVYRSGKVLYSLAKTGKAAVNPATIWVDAALACLDAINAYLRLQRAKEITKQLTAVRDALEHRVFNNQKILDMHLTDIQEDTDLRLETLDRYFNNYKIESERLILDVSNNRNDMFENMKSISKLRKSGQGYSSQLAKLLKTADALVFATLHLIKTG
ncbi:hypothetical protein [Marinomonas sp. PE14-40]|uniref:hypothetical protein n=1 Tax=Marinomonas sp. PE14-40 TaxID=3060621 RepID=UPI003F66BEF3